jgi:hypothetical protein
VNRKTLFAALACALLVFSMLGCGTTNKLKSIQLNATFINGVAPTLQNGVYSFQGNGGTIQLQAIATYSGGKTQDLTKVVTYNVIVDPAASVDAFGNPLVPPCQTPCQIAGQGTVEYNPTGLFTAVEPAVCTWVDVVPAPGTPGWAYQGDYLVTVTYQGITSQPVFLPVASATGNPNNPALGSPGGVNNNPDSLCGPTS